MTATEKKIEVKYYLDRSGEATSFILKCTTPSMDFDKSNIYYLPADVRRNFVIGIVGSNGTGKSTKIRQIINKWKENRPNGKVAILDPQKQFEDLTDFKIPENDINWAKSIKEERRDCLVVLDDYKFLIPENEPTPYMRDLFVNKRVFNNDYIFSCHEPSDILEMLNYFITHIYMFHTNNGEFNKNIPNAELINEASRMINKFVKKYGKGKHPQAKDFKGQRFPYVIAEIESQSLKAINMNPN